MGKMPDQRSVDIESPDERFKEELREKDNTIYETKKTNEKLYMKVRNLENNLEQEKLTGSTAPSGTYLADGPNPSHISKELNELSNNSTGFVRNFSTTLKSGGADLGIFKYLQPDSKSVETGYLQRSLASFLNHHLFLDFENVRFKRGGSNFFDVSLRRKEYFSEFKTLDEGSGSKSSNLFDEFVTEKWETFKISLVNHVRDKKDLVSKLLNGNDKSLQSSFTQVAIVAWKLHRLAFSFNTPASIIRVDKGFPVDGRNVKLHNYFEEQWEEEGRGNDAITEFMIFPGFEIQSTIIPCRVYPFM